MKKTCGQCGNEFEAYQAHHRLCQACHSPTKKEDLSKFLLSTYYDSNNNLTRDVFIGAPESLANIFAKDGLATKQLRDVYRIVLRARNMAFLQGISVARPILYECRRDAAYQLKRDVIPMSFSRFIEHHLGIAEKDEKMLEGFCQHLASILAYYPKERGGQK